MLLMATEILVWWPIVGGGRLRGVPTYIGVEVLQMMNGCWSRKNTMEEERNEFVTYCVDKV